MRNALKALPVVLVCGLTFSALGCNKAPAQAALAAVDQAFTAAKPELEKYVPQEAKSLGDAVQDARAKFEAGQYTEVLAAAKDLTPKIAVAVEAAGKKKSDMVKAFGEMQASVPALVASLTAKAAELAKAKKLPAGLDKAKLESAQTEIINVNQSWTEIAAAFDKGDIAGSLQKAQGVKAKAEELATLLGVTGATATPGK